MKIRGVDFVLYNVTNFERAKKFYQDTLGLKLLQEFGGAWAEFETGTLALAIGAYGAQPIPAGQKSNAVAALAVDDVKAAVEQLKGRGVKINQEPQEFPPCFTATIADPDGNEIILHQRKDGTVG
ncbi:Glyoxalase/bleomycin resistance protein/dioxygenase [Verrucomicrobia bacterium]|nr:Glyoxalase/bleomycin resistance protein/dioxygenase [Verrucomicrobiota bacterium]